MLAKFAQTFAVLFHVGTLPPTINHLAIVLCDFRLISRSARALFRTSIAAREHNNQQTSCSGSWHHSRLFVAKIATSVSRHHYMEVMFIQHFTKIFTITWLSFSFVYEKACIYNAKLETV